MEKKRFQVEVACRQRSIYEIEADDASAAKRLAVERWQAEDPGDLEGFDWCELLTVSVAPARTGLSEAQDDELALRFITEREQLLLRLGSSLVGPTANDAISAPQLAMDLGWRRPDDSGGGGADVVRAARALERLCEKRRLVRFTRTRARAGERGEIRLYCTAGYLEQLSAALEPELAPRKETTA